MFNFYIASYKDEKKWRKHVEKHVGRLKLITQETIPVSDDIVYRDINLTLLFGGEPVLVIFEPSDFKKKFILYNRQTGWMLILLATHIEKIIVTSFYLTEADTPEAYYKDVKKYKEIDLDTTDDRVKEVADGGKGYYRRPTEKEKEFLRQLRSQCRYVGC